VPPSRHNPAVPDALDRVIARCLAKNPKDRFSSCEELAGSLYPLARARTDAAVPKIKRRSWWSKPSGQRDVWIAAAACLLLAAFVPASRALRARYAGLAAPSTRVSLPALPSFALTSTSQTAAELSRVEAHGDLVALPQPKQAAPRRSSKSKPAPAQLKHPSNAPDASLNASRDAISPKPSVDAPAAQVAPTIGLHIEISSTVNEGTLAIFADRELLFTTNLKTETPGEPVRVEHALPVGSHQFRVALYKPDRSLVVEKEGLAEIASDGENRLAVRVNRRTKLLVRHELALDVTWPGSPASSAAHNSPGATTSASMK
jgi:hypothetical protein